MPTFCVNAPNRFEAFADAVEPLADDAWGVYEEACTSCGKKIIIVATVNSVEYGYAEAFEDGQPICSACAFRLASQEDRR